MKRSEAFAFLVAVALMPCLKVAWRIRCWLRSYKDQRQAKSHLGGEGLSSRSTHGRTPMYSDDTILVTLALIAAIGVGGVLSLISLLVMAIDLAVGE